MQSNQETDIQKVILITGATGSIGGALARYYARPGIILHLHGRRKDVLQQLAEQCRAQGADVLCHSTDLLDADALITWLTHIDNDCPIDLAFANAGINIGNGVEQGGEDPYQIAQLLDLNVKSTILFTDHLAKRMRQRGKGQLVLMSSLAAYSGLPVTPSYCASKAAVKIYGEALRGWLTGTGVGVSVVMPGYVSSDMCHAMEGPKPFLMSSERAAIIISRGVSRNRARITFPFPLNLATWLLSNLPVSMTQWILRRLDYNETLR